MDLLVHFDQLLFYVLDPLLEALIAVLHEMLVFLHRGPDQLEFLLQQILSLVQEVNALVDLLTQNELGFLHLPLDRLHMIFPLLGVVHELIELFVAFHIGKET